MKVNLLKIFALIIILLVFPTKYFSQQKVSLDNKYVIDFVRSISSNNSIQEKNILNRITNLIFGDSEIKLQKPISVIAKDSTTFLVLDQGLLNIILLDLKNNEVQEIPSEFEFPSLVAISNFEKNKFLLSDSRNNQIYIYNQESASVDFLNQSIELNKPTGIGYLNSKKEIWIAETGSHSIVVLDQFGKFKYRIGQRGIKKGEFNFPTSMWVNKDENVYIVDALNFRIQIFDFDGNFINMFGEQGDATGYLARPKGIATDSHGNIYIVDALFHTVQIFNNTGIYLSNIGSQGTEEGNFWLPNGIFIDNHDRIYVADSYNSRIQIFQLTQDVYEQN